MGPTLGVAIFGAGRAGNGHARAVRQDTRNTACGRVRCRSAACGSLCRNPRLRGVHRLGSALATHGCRPGHGRPAKPAARTGDDRRRLGGKARLSGEADGRHGRGVRSHVGRGGACRCALAGRPQPALLRLDRSRARIAARWLARVARVCDRHLVQAVRRRGPPAVVSGSRDGRRHVADERRPHARSHVLGAGFVGGVDSSVDRFAAARIGSGRREHRLCHAAQRAALLARARRLSGARRRAVPGRSDVHEWHAAFRLVLESAGRGEGWRIRADRRSSGSIHSPRSCGTSCARFAVRRHCGSRRPGVATSSRSCWRPRSRRAPAARSAWSPETVVW